MRLTHWVHDQLVALGELNRSCSPRLHTLLRDNHNIRLWPDAEGPAGHRGTAIFSAYDPWNTCLRVVPGSFRYFGAAQKQGIINGRESLELSLALIDCCRNLKSRYQGHFSYFYNSPKVLSFLNCQTDIDVLHLLELVEGACADVLYGCVPWPVRPEHHLIARTLRSITFARSATEEPFSQTMDAIEFACWGPWIGFSPQNVKDILAELQSTPPGEDGTQQRSDLSVAGRRMMLPFFSNGFQGIVVGFFIGIDDIAAEHIRTELMQYGQTLADKWSMLRRRHFTEVLKESRSAEHIAEFLVQLVSPVDYVIVRSSDQISGYRLRREGSYWAGHESIEREMLLHLAQQKADIRLGGGEIPGIEAAIKTLSGYSMLDPVLTHARLEMILQHHVEPQAAGPAKSLLTFDALQNLQDLLREKANSGRPSQATLRQQFVVDKVMRNFKSGQISISNNELKSFFEKAMHVDRSMNGYQISSHIGDIEKIFEGTVKITKTRNSIKLKWSN